LAWAPLFVVGLLGPQDGKWRPAPYLFSTGNRLKLLQFFKKLRLQLKPIYTSQNYAISFQKGEETAFDWFFYQLYPTLCLFAQKIIGNQPASEEIASDAFIKIWKRHNQFSNPDAIKAYLYEIVRNDSLKWLSKHSREKKAHHDASYLSSQIQKDHFQAMISSEISRHLQTAINHLPRECAKVFRMLYIEGKTINETAEELKLSQSTVKTQKNRGINFLRKKEILFK
jgi:RNA polymerase sigma-70 factor, ECF subfamily